MRLKIPTTFVKKGLLYVRFRAVIDGKDRSKRICFGPEGDKKVRDYAMMQVLAYKMGSYDPFQKKEPKQRVVCLSEVLELYLKWQYSRSKASHLEQISRVLGHFCGYLGMDSDIKELSLQKVQQYDVNSASQKKDGRLAKASVNSYLKDINTFLNWLLERNYVDKKMSFRLNTAPQHNIFLSSKEFEWLLEQMPESDEHYKRWFRLAFVSGLRLSEQYYLRCSQIVQINDHCVIKVGMIESGNEKMTKTGNSRMVIIEQKDAAFVYSLVTEGADLVFPERLSDMKSYSKVFKKRIKKYMPQKQALYYHCLRKSYGMYLLADCDRDLGYVQAMLGHKSVLTTQKWYSNYQQLIQMKFTQ